MEQGMTIAEAYLIPVLKSGLQRADEVDNCLNRSFGLAIGRGFARMAVLWNANLG